MITKSIIAFLLGGLLCVIAQILIDKTSFTPAKILVSFVVFGVFLGAIGLFEPVFEVAGCGISVPLVGFGGIVAKGVREAVESDGFFGILGGAFSSASIGCTAALLCGFVASVFSKGKSKRL